MNNFKKHILLVCINISLYNCGLYKFVTSSLPKEVKTFSIKSFYCRLPQSEAVYISSKINKNLKMKLESILKPKEKNGDIKFYGELIDYRRNRIGEIYEVTVKVEIIYTNYEGKEEKIPFEKHHKLKDGEKIVTTKILDNLINEIAGDIWDKTVSKWE